MTARQLNRTSVFTAPPPGMTLLDFLTNIAGHLSWQDFALCAETDPDAFFPEKGESNRPAKKVCAGCPVRMECREDALARDEQWGVWGGLTLRERRNLKRQRELGVAA